MNLVMRSLLRADATVLLRSRASTVLSVLLPIVILVVTMFGKAQPRLGSPESVLGLALTLGMVTSCLLGYSLTLAHDREVGVLQRLRVTPAPAWMIMASRLLVQLSSNLVASVIVVIVGTILRGLSLSIGQYGLVFAVAVLGAAMFLSIGQALVALVKSTAAINASGRVLFIILILLGLLGGTGILGDTMKIIAEWSPIGALMTLFADALNNASWSDQDAQSLLACTAYIVAFSFVGIRWFRWDSR